MCACMFMYMYIYICIYIYIMWGDCPRHALMVGQCPPFSVGTGWDRHIDSYICSYTYVCIYPLYIYIYTHIHVHMRMCVYVYIYTYIYIYTYVNMFTYTIVCCTYMYMHQVQRLDRSGSCVEGSGSEGRPGRFWMMLCHVSL